MERERGKKPPEGKKKKKKSSKTKKKKPIDTAAVELAAENAKRELVEFLQTKTELSEEEILVAYDHFHEKYPSGEINKQEFLIQSKVSPDRRWVRLTALHVGRSVHSGGSVPSVWSWRERQPELLRVPPGEKLQTAPPPPLTSYLSWQANSVKNLNTPQDKLGWMVTF